MKTMEERGWPCPYVGDRVVTVGRRDEWRWANHGQLDACTAVVFRDSRTRWTISGDL